MSFWTKITSMFSKGDETMTDTKTNGGTLKGWRTILFNSAVAVVGVLATVSWPDMIPPQYAGAVVAAIGFLNMYLRSVTNTPAGQK
jgi:hypothetical protein